MNIPLNAIHPGETQPRHNLNLSPSFIRSVENHGILVPVILYKNCTGYNIGDGHRRVAAANEAGRDTLEPHEYVVRTPEEADPTLTARLANAYREKLNPLEWAEIFAADLEGGSTHEEVAQTYGVSRGKVSQYTKLLRALTPEVEQAIHAGHISFTHARQFARLSNEVDLDDDARLRQRQRELLSQIQKADWNVPSRRLTAWVDKILSPSASPVTIPTSSDEIPDALLFDEPEHTAPSYEIHPEVVEKIVEEGDDPVILYGVKEAIGQVVSASHTVQQALQKREYGQTLAKEVQAALDELEKESRALLRLLRA